MTAGPVTQDQPVGQQPKTEVPIMHHQEDHRYSEPGCAASVRRPAVTEGFRLARYMRAPTRAGHNSPLRMLHRRCGHASAVTMNKLLAGEGIPHYRLDELQHVINVCTTCQMRSIHRPDLTKEPTVCEPMSWFETKGLVPVRGLAPPVEDHLQALTLCPLGVVNSSEPMRVSDYHYDSMSYYICYLWVPELDECGGGNLSLIHI